MSDPPTDPEAAPLLSPHDDGTQNGYGHREDDSILVRALNEPISALSKLLLALCLILLLLSTTFIGLFAGTAHRLNETRSHHPKTEWRTETETFISTKTQDHSVTTTKTITPAPGPTIPLEPKACMSTDCVLLAASVLSNLNTTADPCEDFYEFANGGWFAENPLPSGKANYDVFSQVSKANNLAVKKILETAVIPPSETSDAQSLAKLQKLYQSCVNEDALDAQGSEPLLRVVRRIKELFPASRTPDDAPTTVQHVLTPRKKYQHDLTAVTAYVHSLDIAALFALDIDGDVGTDPDFMTLWFSQTELGLPSKEYYEEKEIVNTYVSVIGRLLEALDEDTAIESTWPWPWPWPDEDPPATENRTAKAKRLSHEVVTFEQKLAQYGADLDVLYQDPMGTYNPQPLRNLTHYMPYMDVPTYVSSFAPRNFPNRVIVTYPSYPRDLEQLLATTTPEVVQAYFVTRAALDLSGNLGPNTEPWKISRELVEVLNGLKKGAVPDRSEWCLSRVEEALGFASGRFYVKELFSSSARAKALGIIEDVIGAFKKTLPTLKWMDKSSASAAAEKASAIRVKVGYPIASPNTENAASVAGFYRLVKVDSEDFFDNVLSARINGQIKKWYQLGKQRDKESWEMFPTTVNAYFNPPANEIVFPAGILRAPFFGENWPAYLSYGSFGAVAAHELTHAFDSAGRLYNQHGKLEQWWSNKTSAEFDVRKTCLSRQYSEYSVEDGKGNKAYVNGNLTSGENIGDSGLIQTWRAWKSKTADSHSAAKLNYRLPGVEYTEDQLFFISFARTWARTTLPSAAVQRVRTDPHSPPRFRVEGTLRNIPEFAKAFNCSAKAKLNPPNKDRCVFW